MSPIVSILMPTVNSSRFLHPRLDSIFEQSISDWELIVVDSYSNDGTWEVLSEHAQRDERLRLYQEERQGVYPAINSAIAKARGEFIYIATSDDTMLPNCLERMLRALEKYQNCDLCHSTLKVIDNLGDEIPNWWKERPATRFYGKVDEKSHIRIAPMDGILHICLNTVFGSLTQLLIRRSAFDKIGLFRADWGPRGDFEWGMRAGTLCNVIHIPEILATWRIHDNQVTSPPIGSLLRSMVEAALPVLQSNYPEVYRVLNLKKMRSYYRRLEYSQRIQGQGNLISAAVTACILLLMDPVVTSRVIYMAMKGENVRRSEDRIFYMRTHLSELGLMDSLIIEVN